MLPDIGDIVPVADAYIRYVNEETTNVLADILLTVLVSLAPTALKPALKIMDAATFVSYVGLATASYLNAGTLYDKIEAL